MSEGERDYLLQRASQERLRARRCADTSAARAHRLLAEEYDRRARQMTVRATMPGPTAR